MATKDAIFSAALNLPPDERAELAAKLLRSLDGQAELREAEDAWDAEMECRAREVLDGTATTVPWSEARERLLARPRPQR